MSHAQPLTYGAFYGFVESPFGVPTDSYDPKFIYRGASFDRAIHDLVDAFARGDALAVLVGDAGVGKSTLCRSLAEQLPRRTVISLLANPSSSLDDLLKRVLIDFGVVSATALSRLAAATSQDLMTAVGDFAASLAPLQASALIVVDGVQNLPPEALQALSALTEASAGNRRVQVLLVGRLDFLQALRRTELRSVEQRIAIHCRLDPLTADETSAYVAHRLAVAAPNGRLVFDPGAVVQLHAATHGVPYLVNRVCDRALARGSKVGAGVIDNALISAAAVDTGLAPENRSGQHAFPRVAWVVVILVLLLVAAAVLGWLSG